MRIDEESETAGLDLHEHRTVVCPEFLMMAPVHEMEPATTDERDLRFDAIQREATEALRQPFSRPVVIPPA